MRHYPFARTGADNAGTELVKQTSQTVSMEIGVLGILSGLAVAGAGLYMGKTSLMRIGAGIGVSSLVVPGGYYAYKTFTEPKMPQLAAK